jgi:apolipoprotein N-acyltransferase
MGLFDKLFGRPGKPNGTPKTNVDTTQPVVTAEMLNEDKFWQIVDKSLRSTKNQDDQERYLIAEIEKLTPQEMIGFRLRTDYFAL